MQLQQCGESPNTNPPEKTSELSNAYCADTILQLQQLHCITFPSISGRCGETEYASIWEGPWGSVTMVSVYVRVIVLVDDKPTQQDLSVSSFLLHLLQNDKNCHDWSCHKLNTLLQILSLHLIANSWIFFVELVLKYIFGDDCENSRD